MAQQPIEELQLADSLMMLLKLGCDATVSETAILIAPVHDLSDQVFCNLWSYLTPKISTCGGAAGSQSLRPTDNS
jgi:hypothetical protein